MSSVKNAISTEFKCQAIFNQQNKAMRLAQLEILFSFD
jgi:hypothetical protein